MCNDHLVYTHIHHVLQISWIFAYNFFWRIYIQKGRSQSFQCTPAMNTKHVISKEKSS